MYELVMYYSGKRTILMVSDNRHNVAFVCKLLTTAEYNDLLKVGRSYAVEEV